MSDPKLTHPQPAAPTPAEPVPVAVPSSIVQAGRPDAVPGWLRRELSNPLFRNAYALILNGGLTTLLGAAFWALGPFFYSPGDVGRNLSMNQTIMFVGGVTMLNFLLIRFIPETARHTRALVLSCYALGTVSALAVGGCFLLILNLRGQSWETFDHLRGAGPGLAFLAAVVAWNLWNAMEGVFIGLRRAVWVPVVNTVWSLTRLGLIIALATPSPHYGIVLAWYVPAMVVLIPVNVLFFRRFIPAHRAANFGRGNRSTHSEIARHLGGGYLGGAFQFASLSLIPVVVATRLPPTTAAYFQVAWVGAMMLDLASTQLSFSLTVEGSFDRERLAEQTRGALRRTVLLMTPVTVLVILVAPYALEIYEHSYNAAAPMLQVLAAAVLPKAVIELYVGVLRVQNRTRLIAVLQAVRLFGALGLVLLLIDPAHLYTIGVAVVVVNVAVAAAILPGLLKITRSGASVLTTDRSSGEARGAWGSAPRENTDGSSTGGSGRDIC